MLDEKLQETKLQSLYLSTSTTDLFQELSKLAWQNNFIHSLECCMLYGVKQNLVLLPLLVIEIFVRQVVG